MSRRMLLSTPFGRRFLGFSSSPIAATTARWSRSRSRMAFDEIKEGDDSYLFQEVVQKMNDYYLTLAWSEMVPGMATDPQSIDGQKRAPLGFNSKFSGIANLLPVHQTHLLHIGTKWEEWTSMIVLRSINQFTRLSVLDLLY